MQSPRLSPSDVLVLGSDQRQGLAVVRALARHGLRVVAAGQSPERAANLGRWSRYPHARVEYPSPGQSEADFLAAVRTAVEVFQPRLVLPAVESAMIPLDHARDRFADTSLALPPREVLHRALDKLRTYEIAARVGVPMPRTLAPEQLQEAHDFARQVGYPLVVKPRGMAAHTGDPLRVDYKVRYPGSEAQLASLVGPLLEAGNRPVLQELCRGFKVCHGVMMAGGELTGLYEYAGVREYPLSGGVTCLHVTRAPTPEMVDWSRRLLHALAWDGLAQVEYKVDPTTGRAVLMEVNGRVWAPMSGALKAGLDFPWAAWKWYVEGTRMRLPSEYPVGQQTRYLRGELRALASAFRTGGPDRVGDPSTPWAVLGAQLRACLPPVRDDVFDASDPLPWVADALGVVAEAGRGIGASLVHRFRRPSPADR